MAHLHLIYIEERKEGKKRLQQQGKKPQGTNQVYQCNHISINLASCITFY